LTSNEHKKEAISPALTTTAGQLMYGVWKASWCNLRGPKFRNFPATLLHLFRGMAPSLYLYSQS